MRRVKQWTVAIVVGLVVAAVADAALGTLGHSPTMSGGLAVGAGVAVGALTGRWLERRHRAREMLARFNEVDHV